MIRSITRHAMAVSIVGAIALTACGSDSDNADTTVAGTVAAGAPATDAGPVATDAVPATPYVDDDDGYGSPPATEPADTASGNTDAPAAADGTTLTIKEFEFSPVTVAAGQPFTLSNEDGFAHTVSSRDDFFDVRVDGGTTESLTIDNPGTYEIFCRIHTSMSGSITVT